MSENIQGRDLTPEEAQALLKKTHVHFAVPAYGGNVSEPTFSSFIRFTVLAMQYGINFSLDTMTNESLIPRGRNNMVAKFLNNKDATHLMFVDADIGFDPEAVLRLILHDAPVVCGLYAMKGLPINYVLNIVPGARRNGSLFEVSTSGTGFMLINRSVITDLIAAMPQLQYKDSLNLGEQYAGNFYALFDTMIDENQHYLSEDWTFCKRVREVLHKPIWVDTEIKLDHFGNFKFEGSVTKIKELTDIWEKSGVNADEQVKAYDELSAQNVVENTTVDVEAEKVS